VTSDDDLTSQAEADWNEALLLVPFLRSLEEEYADPERPGPLRKRTHDTLNTVLIAAIRLLKPDHWVMPLLNELLGHLINENVDLRLMWENSGYVARALEDRFRCYPSPAAREAQQVAGFLRELQKKCQDRRRDGDPLEDTVQQVLQERLAKAKALLEEVPWIVAHLGEICDELELGTAPRGTAREDAGYVAGVLEVKFGLGGGGGYGDTSLNIKHLGFNSWKAFGFPIFMLWLVASAQRQQRARIYARSYTRLLAREEPHQHHHGGERG